MTLIATDVMASVMVSVMARSMVDENDDDSRRVKPTLNHISKTPAALRFCAHTGSRLP